MPSERLCVVIPVYNEEAIVSDVIEMWRTTLDTLQIDYRIRLYNDGSTDGSLAVMRRIAARNRRIEIRDKPNSGHGPTILQGYRDAIADKFDWIFQIDSDNELGASEFPELWARRNDGDLIAGHRSGREQPLSRKIVSFVSRLCVRLFFGKSIWDVNVPYRLMRVSAFKSDILSIPANTFAPNVIVSGIAARNGARCCEIPVQHHCRTTGEVSIRKLKLLKSAMRSFRQTIGFALKTSGAYGKRLLPGIAMILAYGMFALIPGTLWNWAYDYFQFIPAWGIVACLAATLLVVLLPKVGSNRSLRIVSIMLALSLIVCFIIFRTRIHCFCGDSSVACIPQDSAFPWHSLIPRMPGSGRLDTYGIHAIGNLAWRSGIMAHFPGMFGIVQSQIYDFVFGTIYVLVAISLFWRRPGLMLMILTMPHIFNFFGNVDCYPLPLCVSLLFMAAAFKVLSSPAIKFWQVLLLGLFWLFCGWVHPLAGAAGFLPAIAIARWFNSRRFVFRIPEYVICIAYAIVFFAILVVTQQKAVFTAAYEERPPMFSIQTAIHAFNVCILPILPLAMFVLLGPAPRKAKSLCLTVWGLQIVCFVPMGFTQGANDQFPYSLYFIGVAMPWLIAAWEHPIGFVATKCVIALHLLLLIPMIWVHSTNLTVTRARTLYPLDLCKHNKEMSWQVHLGLLLGDNMVDSPIVKNAALSIFEDGSKNAYPASFKAGNYLYYVAFQYHYGEFERGRTLLKELLKKNPQAVNYLLAPRPMLIYLNRQRLWDDLYELFPGEREKPVLKQKLDVLRAMAEKEQYCINPPSFAKCPY